MEARCGRERYFISPIKYDTMHNIPPLCLVHALNGTFGYTNAVVCVRQTWVVTAVGFIDPSRAMDQCKALSAKSASSFLFGPYPYLSSTRFEIQSFR